MSRTLIIRSGGGMPGLDIHAGIGIALDRLGIIGTDVIGTSAGAIISALDASGKPAMEIADIINDLSDEEVRQPRFMWRARPWINNIFSPRKIELLLERLLPPTFQQLSKRCGIHATRVRDGAGITFGHIAVHKPIDWLPPLRQSVMASMAIHGFFPDVRIDRDYYADGGTSNNVPLPYDLTPYDRVVICIATPPVLYRRKSNYIARMLTNVSWLMRGQINATLARISSRKVIVLWPDVAKDCGTMRFRHSLIIDSFKEAMEQLQGQL